MECVLPQLSIWEQVTQCETPERCPTHLVVLRGYTLKANGSNNIYFNVVLFVLMGIYAFS